MNNRRKEGLTPFTRMMALLIASAMVVGLGIFAQDAYVKASEEDGEDGVVTEVADEVVEMPAPEVEPVEEIAEIVYEAPAPEPVAEPEPEPVAEEPVAEEPAPAEPIEEPAPTEPEQPEVPAEEEVTPVAAEPEEEEEDGITDEDFDIEKAYEHYLKLSDAEKAEYLDSLNEEHRNVLIYYIEAHAFLEGETDSIGEEAPEVIRAEEAEEYIPAEAEEVTPAEEEAPVKAENEAEEAEPTEETEPAVDEEPVEEPEPEAKPEPEVEPEPEVVALEEETTFSTVYLSGTWAGRETSTARNVEFTVVKDGNVVASGSTLCHMSMINLAVTPGDYEVTDIQCSSLGFSGSGFNYVIDMYGDTNVTLYVELTSPDYVAAEEVTEVEIIEEIPAEEIEEPVEEVEESPTEEVTEEAAEAYSVNDEWTGRETSTDRTLTVIFNIDGEEAERKEIIARYTEATFTVDTTEYELISIESENEITVEGNVCRVSFEDEYEATVIVNLATIEVEEEVEISEEEENEEDEPTYEIVSEWAGEETENTKVLTVVINVDGEEKEVKTIEGNTIKPSFMIETEGYELKEITSEAAFTLEDKLCKVDMSEEDEATVVVELIIAGEEADEAEKEPVMVDVTKHLENLSRNDGTFEIGDTVRWVAELQEDVDPDTVIYAWFSSPDHGVTINEMEGNESTYTYVLTEENCGDAWLVKAMKK